MPDETTDRYRAAAEAYFGEAYADMPWNPKWAERMAETRCFRAAVDANRDRDEAAGREAAAQAIIAHADKHAPERASAMRRHLHIAARVAAGPMTDAQMVEAIQRGDFAVCHLDGAGRPEADA